MKINDYDFPDADVPNATFNNGTKIVRLSMASATALRVSTDQNLGMQWVQSTFDIECDVLAEALRRMGYTVSL